MNRKGFTLIELLAVIVLIGIVSIIVVPSALDYYDNSKNSSYNILIKNIKIAAENYYTECEYGDINGNQYCDTMQNNELRTTIGSLTQYGFLKPSSEDDNGNPIVEDPRDSSRSLNNCNIAIVKNKVEYNVTYEVISGDSPDKGCPTDEDYGSEQ